MLYELNGLINILQIGGSPIGGGKKRKRNIGGDYEARPYVFLIPCSGKRSALPMIWKRPQKRGRKKNLRQRKACKDMKTKNTTFIFSWRLMNIYISFYSFHYYYFLILENFEEDSPNDYKTYVLKQK